MRYFLDRDNDGHWYIINSDKRDEWSEWVDADGEDEYGWSIPVYAQPINGNPSRVEFDECEIK